MAEERDGDILVRDNDNDGPAPLGAYADSTSMPPPLLVHDADEANKTARVQQMRGLNRRRRKFSRVIQAPKKHSQKNIDFDYTNYNNNAQQARAAIAPAKKSSPIAKVKRDRICLKGSLAKVSRSRLLLEEEVEKHTTTISNLKSHINELGQELRRERKVSNRIIDDAMIQARLLSREAMEMMEEAKKKCTAAEDNIIAERDRATTRVRGERAIQARQEARHEEKLKTILEKRDQENEAAIKLITTGYEKKYAIIKHQLANTCKTLGEQYAVWCKHRGELYRISASRVSNERHRSRDLIQHQIDKASAKEKELQVYISKLEGMNNELSDKVAAAKQDQRQARKQLKTSTLLADRRLGKLLSAKEETGTLKDELTQVLKSYTSQQEVLDEYKLMVEGLKSTKCSFDIGPF